MKWPEYFPEDCPPEDAEATTRTLFRFADKFPLGERDRKSKREINPDKEPFGDKELECKACGLSLFSDLEAMREMMKRVKGFRQSRIIRCHITENDGLLKETPGMQNKSHCTLWIFPGVSFGDSCELVE